MKVLFLTTTLPRYPGDGQSPFVLEQAQAWKTARPADEVIILAPDDSSAKKKETLDGVVVFRYQFFWPRSLQRLPYPALLPNVRKNPLLLIQLPFLMLSAVCNLLFKKELKNADLVYAHWIVPNGLVVYIAHLASRIAHRKIKYVIHNHSSDLRLLTKIPLIGKSIARSIIRNAEVFFCVNSQLKQEAVSLFEKKEQGLIEKKIVVLPMGVTMEKLKNQIDKSTNQAQNQKFKVKYDIGFIGRLTEKKGVNKLLDAVKLLEKDKEVRIGIAGTGEEEQDIRDKIKELRINATLIGQIDNTEKQKFFQETKLFVFPSLSINGDIEGIPVSLLEALCQGKQVVVSGATNIELLPEWKRLMGNVALCSNPGDVKELALAIKSVLELPRREMNKRALDLQEVMKRYEWSSLIREYFLSLGI